MGGMTEAVQLSETRPVEKAAGTEQRRQGISQQMGRLCIACPAVLCCGLVREHNIVKPLSRQPAAAKRAPIAQLYVSLHSDTACMHAVTASEAVMVSVLRSTAVAGPHDGRQGAAFNLQFDGRPLLDERSCNQE